MKILSKTGAIILLLFFFNISLSADINQSIKNLNSRFILNGRDIIDPRAIYKIDIMGSELYSKSGISVFIYASSKYGKSKFSNMEEKIKYIRSFEKNITDSLVSPFAILTMSLEDTHVNILFSKSLEGLIDKDMILNRHIVPLLASRDKNTIYAKVSAAMLNGYASIVDNIAEKRGIKLKSSIGNSGVIASSIWRIFMYSVVFIGLTLYLYATFRARRD